MDKGKEVGERQIVKKAEKERYNNKPDSMSRLAAIQENDERTKK